MKKIYSLLLMTLILAGCSEQFDVKYLHCDIQGEKCITVAKFKSLDVCERVKFKDSAYCDQVTVPGKMICDTHRKSTISTSFCTK
jgi:PBP1b-binding outer membrane lipoprotein LpoB